MENDIEIILDSVGIVHHIGIITDIYLPNGTRTKTLEKFNRIQLRTVSCKISCKKKTFFDSLFSFTNLCVFQWF